jgi:tetratricopeptide (TPR) repeat protein
LQAVYRETASALVIKDVCAEDDLAAFKSLGIAYLKIGMDLVRHITTDPTAREFIEKIIKIAGAANWEVIAEGIHTRTEMEKLAELGVKYGQGYFFAKPETVFAELVRIEDYLADKDMEKSLLSYIYFKRGKNYFQKGDYDKAILEYSKVMEVDKNNLEALYYRASSFSEEGGIIAALNDLQKILSIDPYYPEAQFLRGFIFEKKGDLEAALKAYGEYVDEAKEGLHAQVELASERIRGIRKKLADRAGPA